MKLSDLTNHAGEWLRGSGPMSEIVISSRIRLARNLAGNRFLSRCTTKGQRQEIEQRVRDTILEAQLAPQMLYVDLDKAPRDAAGLVHFASSPFRPSKLPPISTRAPPFSSPSPQAAFGSEFADRRLAVGDDDAADTTAFARDPFGDAPRGRLDVAKAVRLHGQDGAARLRRE